MNKHDLAKLAAESRVPVTRVATGTSALNLTDREWHFRVRDPKPAKTDPTTERHIRGYDRLGRAIIVNGLGELIAVE